MPDLSCCCKREEERGQLLLYSCFILLVCGCFTATINAGHKSEAVLLNRGLPKSLGPPAAFGVVMRNCLPLSSLLLDSHLVREVRICCCCRFLLYDEPKELGTCSMPQSGFIYGRCFALQMVYIPPLSLVKFTGKQLAQGEK